MLPGPDASGLIDANTTNTLSTCCLCFRIALKFPPIEWLTNIIYEIIIWSPDARDGHIFVVLFANLIGFVAVIGFSITLLPAAYVLMSQTVKIVAESWRWMSSYVLTTFRFFIPLYALVLFDISLLLIAHDIRSVSRSLR
jgi:hypothetical protein